MTKRRALELIRQLPDELKGAKVLESEVAHAESMLNIRFPEDYRTFLLEFGGAIISSYQILGLRKPAWAGESGWHIVDENKTYWNLKWPNIEDWVVFAIDNGNPIGFNQRMNNSIYVSDLDVGYTGIIAFDFYDFVLRECFQETYGLPDLPSA